MTAYEIRKLANSRYAGIIRHKNGNLYAVNGKCKMQINGVWVDAVLYVQSSKPFGQFCRAESDFANFEEVL